MKINEELQKTLLQSIQKKNLSETKDLIEKGALINVKTCHPNYTQAKFKASSPLHMACEIGSLETVQYLLEKQADLEITDEGESGYGCTPLFIAATKGFSDICRLLCDQQANLNHQNRFGMPLISAAAQGGIFWLVEKCLHQNNAINLEKHSPLYYAALYGHSEIAEYLLSYNADPYHENILFAACEGGLLWLVRQILAKHFTIQTTDDSGISLLHFAAMGKGTINVAEYLLAQGADVNAKIQEGYYETRTPLYFCGDHDNVEVAELLIAHGAQVNLSDQFEHTPLTVAAQNNSFRLLKLLVDQGANLDFEDKYALGFDYRDKPFIFWVIDQNQPDLLKSCIHAGADVNQGDFLDIKPLHCAAEKGFIEICKILLEAGADINALSGFKGDTPLLLAVTNGDEELTRYLISRGADMTPSNEEKKSLLHACVHGRLFWLIKYLVEEKKVDVSCRDNFGSTPLHYALSSGNNEAASYLLDQGADIHLTGLSGATVLHNAMNERVEWNIIKKILEKGADPNARKTDYTAETALHFACEKGLSKHAEILLAYGAQASLYTGDQKSPLSLAAAYGHLDIVKILMEQGVDPEFQKNEGWNPLEAALDQNHTAIVDYFLSLPGSPYQSGNMMDMYDQQLIKAAKDDNWSRLHTWLEKNADPNYQDEKGWSALHYLVSSGNESNIKLLLEHGAREDIKNNEGHTPLDLCPDNLKEIVVKIFSDFPQLLPQVEEFTRYLQKRSKLFNPENAYLLLKQNGDLLPCVTKKEMDIFRDLKDGKYDNLIDEILSARSENLLHFGHCRHCGRDTVKPLGKDVLHGNLEAPTRDTEVVWHVTCVSCGRKSDIYV